MSNKATLCPFSFARDTDSGECGDLCEWYHHGNEGCAIWLLIDAIDELRRELKNH